MSAFFPLLEMINYMPDTLARPQVRQTSFDTKWERDPGPASRPTLDDLGGLASPGATHDGTSPERGSFYSGLTSAPQPVGPRRSAPALYRVSGLSTWTGRVVDIDDDLFTAELVPDASTGGPVVLADFGVTSVGADADGLTVGDVVYVTSRTVRAPHGGRIETSSIRLRRLGKWTESEVADIQDRAVQLANELADLID